MLPFKDDNRTYVSIWCKNSSQKLAVVVIRKNDNFQLTFFKDKAYETCKFNA